MMHLLFHRFQADMVTTLIAGEEKPVIALDTLIEARKSEHLLGPVMKMPQQWVEKQPLKQQKQQDGKRLLQSVSRRCSGRFYGNGTYDRLPERYRRSRRYISCR